MSEGSSADDKTEEPTHKKLEDARKKGQITSSREVNNFFMIIAFTIVVSLMFPWIFTDAKDGLGKYIANSHDIEIKENGINDIGVMIVTDSILLIIAPLAFLILAALAGSIIQSGFHSSAESIKPKLEKISVIKGFKRLFSMRSFMEFVKGLIKITIVGYIAYDSVIDEVTQLQKTPSMQVDELIHYISELCMSILIGTCVAMFFMAILDFLYQKWEFMKSMRMTKQEIKDEYKTQEGDPHIKGKLKQIRMERARKRMMSNVPTADVVVTNPIHYAIALKYDQAKGSAPIVVAKGVDKVAEKIKEIANEHKVPIVRNPTLARSLHADCDIEGEIPLQHYQAVAEVISYIYKLKGKKQ